LLYLNAPELCIQQSFLKATQKHHTTGKAVLVSFMEEYSIKNGTYSKPTQFNIFSKSKTSSKVNKNIKTKNAAVRSVLKDQGVI
jgi:hypothetical protein